MKFLKPWLQDYIVETLPEDGVIESELNKKAFEVEEVVVTPVGSVFDIKVLPNRAHDALGHKWMAYELCSTLGLTRKIEKYQDDIKLTNAKTDSQPTAIDDAKACTRFMTVRIDGVKIGESPEWLKKRLEAIGQRSINNVVDITNYVQFALNKPMHAYDSRSIKGTLRARFSLPELGNSLGEALTTLDEKDLILDEKTLVIADEEKVLGLAGIKGGKYSGIQNDTTSVVLESANFAPVLTRKTSQKYGFHTDASKRFENGIANSLIEDGLLMTMKMVIDICGDKNTKVSDVVDEYPKEDMPYHVGISLSELNNILGTKYSNKEIESTFKKLNFTWKKVIPEEEIKRLANRVIKAPYHLGSSVRYDSPDMFDCSSLTSWLYVHSGAGIPRMSIDQYVYTRRINSSDLKIGDLIFANNDIDKIYTSSIEFLKGTKVPEGINHVGIYIGDGNIIHATSMYEKVVVENLGTSPRFVHIVGYGRVLEDINEERYVVEVPSERLDIRIKEDLAEEIGRIIGYDKLVPTLPKLARIGLLHKRMFYENKIREILLANGFSEVITYSFGNEGVVELKKGLADDKEKLRQELGSGMLEALTRNLYNAPLLGEKTIKLFEFGNVFDIDSEKRNFALAIDDGAKKSNFTEVVEMILSEIKRTLNIKEIKYQTVKAKPYVIEIDFDTMITSLPEVSTYEAPSFTSLPMVSYKTVSPYPFITRDIAMWVSGDTTWESIHTLCAEVRNPLVTRIDLFDTFSKEIEGIKKTSYAFRLVFQSYEKTLTDEEVNEMMEVYYGIFKGKGYEIR